MDLPLYVNFKDPLDPEKPTRFEFYMQYFSDSYILKDNETGVRVELTTQYIREQKRLPNETDTQFVVRLVRDILERENIKKLKSGEQA